MLDKIKTFFEAHLSLDPAHAGGRPTGGDANAVRLASCALLLEMMRIDHKSAVVEEQTVREAIRRTMHLTGQEVSELIELAQAELDHSTDYFQFTSLINEHFTPAQKLDVIGAMWEIAYSDQTIDAHERHLMRKMEALLHVPHGDHMAAKARAKARIGCA